MPRFSFSRAVLSSKIVACLSHRYFFIALAGLFFLQMAWIALSSTYPMLFDEEYHLGIIEIYSRSLSPFISVQPPEAAFHGDITRYSSYLFHYLMSFPYRLIALFTSDLMTQVILLRFICIGLVLGGLVLFRKVLLKAGLSRASAHVALLCFTLIPLVPFALAQLNYDALLFIIVPSMLYFSLRAIEKNSQQTLWVALLVGSGCVASITKFTALPILLGCLVFVAVALRRQYGQRLFKKLWRGYRQLPRLRLVAASALLLVSFGLVAERYGVNLVTYRALEPKCDQLHTAQECSQYTVYRRDTTWKANNAAINKPRDNPAIYGTTYWAPHIFNDFFVVGTYVDSDDSLSIRHLPTSLQASAGNIVLRSAGWIILVLSAVLLAVLAVRRHLQPKPLFLLTGLIFVIYAGALFVRNYSDYLHIGTPTAAQGRYFIPLLIPLLALVVVGVGRYLKTDCLRVGLLALALLCFSQGGGVANYMLYSNPKWYWPEQRETITQLNQTARKVLRSFTPF